MKDRSDDPSHHELHLAPIETNARTWISCVNSAYETRRFLSAPKCSLMKSLLKSNGIFRFSVVCLIMSSNSSAKTLKKYLSIFRFSVVCLIMSSNSSAKTFKKYLSIFRFGVVFYEVFKFICKDV